METPRRPLTAAPPLKFLREEKNTWYVNTYSIIIFYYY